MLKRHYSSVVTVYGYGKQTCVSLKEAYDVLGIDKPHKLSWIDGRKHRSAELVGIGRIDVTYH